MSSEIFLAIVLILPGFVSLWVVRKISILEGELPGHEYYFWSLLLSVINFTIFSTITGVNSIDGIKNLIFNPEGIFILYSISLIVGYILGQLCKKIVHGSFDVLSGEVWRITLMSLNKDEGKFVTVVTTNNSEFSGRTKLYSTREDSPREILLSEPIQIIRDDKMEVIKEIDWGAEILFTENDIGRIVFYDETDS